jgi:RNAse (barnase) inhibitor barstar
VPFVTVEIDCGEITDWRSFHDAFRSAFGFPDWYGRNMDAWIDCMTCLDDRTSRLSKLTVEAGSAVVMTLRNADRLKEKNRTIYDALIECSASVNWRRMELGEEPILMLSFHAA